MSAFPHNPDREPEKIDEETRRILDERLATFDEDVKTSRPADEVLAELRARFNPKHPAPR